MNEDLFEQGQMVWIRIGVRPPLNIRIVEVLDDGFYRLDWGSCGFNALLNTVRIPASSIRAEIDS